MAIIAAVLAALAVVIVALYAASLPGQPTDVSVNGVTIVSNYTNLPAGKTPPSVFGFYIAWGSGENESPSVASIHAPAGSEVWLHLLIDDDRYSASGAAANCSVNGINALAPFVIPSLEAQFKSGAWTSHPFPLNFSGETEAYNPPANLVLNVTLPAQDGVYTPTLVVDISCEQYE